MYLGKLKEDFQNNYKKLDFGQIRRKYSSFPGLL